jgi:hypothetical protein
LTDRIVHFVGFRGDEYARARRIWRGPAFIHRWWDRRARREIALDDVVIFATDDAETVQPCQFNAPDIDEDAR